MNEDQPFPEPTPEQIRVIEILYGTIPQPSGDD